jgi:hypothetical protein
MVGVISQLASQPGKKIQEFVKEKTKLFTHKNGNFVKQKTNPACSVVHSIPGRIRLRVPTEDLQYLERLEALLTADAKIKRARINSAAASIVIEYEPSEIPDEQMRSHLFQLIQSASDAVVIPLTNLSSPQPKCERHSTLRTCSIETRQVVVAPESCGLLKSKTKQPLKGVALIARIEKLHRVGILI